MLFKETNVYLKHKYFKKKKNDYCRYNSIQILTPYYKNNT